MRGTSSLLGILCVDRVKGSAGRRKDDVGMMGFPLVEFSQESKTFKLSSVKLSKWSLDYLLMYMPQSSWRGMDMVVVS